ncbi:pyrimidine-specific ribonucleoside hydrolase [Catenuloplanes nepalensis]|uniref:Pyrimidine-specific ribonucleoside hydrolase n=1 Tax=Catenuloplanes nepalensis TaxID=587533 RepID=A0ABT9MT21_9ACTN|nr:nucleoside hydrolase [Catenuloplanes nepalensis]MDP9794539.1 pyrimidine-specific ribonucleoside hydrolase [Catenuloplanes nepalensis]
MDGLRPLLIDCDPGIDDMVALLLACASPEVELLGVSTVAGNVGGELTARNALDVLALAGRSDVPVAVGADRPLVVEGLRGHRGAHGDTGLGGARLPRSPSRPVGGHAVPFLAEMIESSERPVTLVAVGPLTNVALLFALFPDVAARLDRLVVMGGAVGRGNITPAAEFNVWADPEAAYRVLSAPGLPRRVPTTMVGLDVTLRTLIGPADADGLRAAGGAGALVADAIAEYVHGAPDGGGVPMHDAVAVAEAVRPGILDCRPARIDVDHGFGPERGRTVVDLDGAEVSVAVGADCPAVVRFVLDRIVR